MPDVLDAFVAAGEIDAAEAAAIRSESDAMESAGITADGGQVNVDASVTSSKINATPVPPHNSSYNATGHPMVTAEKSTAVDSSSKFSFSVSCPDGSSTTLSPNANDGSNNSSHIILGRGKHGVPSSSAHVSRQACVLRLVENSSDEDETTSTNDKQYSLEMVVLGSQSCRVTRHRGSSSVIFMKSISNIIGSKESHLSPSTLNVRDGDIIEPYDRPSDCSIEEAKSQGLYYPFKVVIINTSNGGVDGTAFAEASWKIDRAAQTKEAAAQTDGREEKTDENVANASNKSAEQPAEDTQDFSMSVDKAAVAGEGSQDVSCEQGMQTSENDNENDDEFFTAPQNLDEMTAEAPSNAIGELEPAEKFYERLRTEADKELDKIFEPVEKALGISAGELESTDKTKENAVKDVEMSDSGNKPTDESAKAVEAPKEDAPSSSSEESSDEEYDIDDPRQTIIELLEAVESPGSFAVGGSCAGKLVMPGLEVDGLGPIGLPLSEGIVAKELAKKCEQAPFGRGAKTIGDKTVRNTFQLAPEHFRVTNPTWKNELDQITKKVCEGLGVASYLTVEARLYKILLCEKGSFFAPHRDSEKEDGMFGTLVVALPSQYTGGELVVSHKGKTETFVHAGDKFQSQYAAFYADCKHELKEVTSGYRLCLVYNLVKVGAGARPSPKSNSSSVKRLTAAARLWGEEYDGNKIVLMTEHQYTPSGIKNGNGSAKYKEGDAAIVELLKLACEKGVDIDYDHGTVSYSETGTAEGDDDYYYHRRRGYYDEYSDDDQNYTWEETTDSTMSLKLAEYGSVGISQEDEMIPEDYFEDKDPENETFEGCYGDVTGERQYADAEAIVLWPRSQRWKIETNGNVSRMCETLLKICEEGTESREECIKKAKTLLPISKCNKSRVNDSADVKKLMKCIVAINDGTLAQKFLTSYLSANPAEAPGVLLECPEILYQFGADKVKSAFLLSISATRFCADPTATANFVIKCCDVLGQRETGKALTNSLMEKFVNVMYPADEASRRAPSKNADNFPLNAILRLLSNHNDSSTLANRVLGGYLWLSRQQASPTRFSADPSGCASSVVQSILMVKNCDVPGQSPGQKELGKELTNSIIEAFVDAMSPVNEASRRVPSKNVDSFPLSTILDLVSDHDDSVALAKRALKGYIWLSCQQVSELSGGYYSYRRTVAPKGPKLLVNHTVIPSLIRLCGKDGWNEYEGILVEATEKLCQYGSTDDALLLIDKLSPPTFLPGDRSRICARMATVACEKILANSNATAGVCKKLVRIIGKHCPLFAPRFAEFAKKLDVRTVLYPLITDDSLRATADGSVRLTLASLTILCVEKSTTPDQLRTLARIISAYCPMVAPQFAAAAKKLDVSLVYPIVMNHALRASVDARVKESLASLTYHCAHTFKARVSNEPGTVQVWSMPASSSKQYSSFLRSPCKKTFDWQIRKSDHAGFIRDLSTLVRTGKVKAESYQRGGRGPYRFKITKLKSTPLSLASPLPTCTCSSGSGYNQTITPSSCLLRESQEKSAKYRDDKNKLNSCKVLLTPEERSRLDGLNRPTNAASASSTTRASASASSAFTANPYVMVSAFKPSRDSPVGIGFPTNVCPIIITSISPMGLFAGSNLKVNMTLDLINGRRYTTFAQGLALIKETQGRLTVTASYATFIPASQSRGTIPGYVFGSNRVGIGYHRLGPTRPSGNPVVQNPYARGSAATSGSSQPNAKKRKTDVIELLDDDVQCEGVMTAEDVITKRRKEAEERGEIVEIN